MEDDDESRLAKKDGDDEKSRRLTRYKQDDSGGYCNPPVRSQFKKDNKLGGRRPGVTNLETELRKRLKKKIEVKTDGDPLFMLPHEIFAQRIIEAILSQKSTPAMIEYGRKLLEEFGSKPVKTTERPMQTSDFSSTELVLTTALLSRMLKEEPQPDRISPLGTEYNRYVTGTYQVSRRADGHVVVEKTSPLNEP